MIEIKIATENDILTLVQFQKNMAFETEKMNLDNEILTQGIQNIIKDKNKGHYYIALYKGEAIGCMMNTYEWSDWRNSTVIWIQSVYIKPELRKMGVFKIMYNFIQEKINNSTDYCGIRLYVDKTNHNALKVYKKIGMNNDHYDFFEWIKS